MTIRSKRRALTCEGRGAAKRGPIAQSGDIRDDDRWEGPREVGQSKTWHQCLVDGFRVFGATERSTEPPLVFGVETELWPIVAKEAG